LTGTLNKSIWIPLILCVIAVLALLLIHGDVPGERAFGAFQAARDLRGLGNLGLHSPLFVLPLALAARLGLPIVQVGASLSVAGWLATLVAVYWIGLHFNRPVIAILAAVALTVEPSFYRFIGQDALFVMGWVWIALAIPNTRYPISNLKHLHLQQAPAQVQVSQISNLKMWVAGLMLIALAVSAMAQARVAPASMLASHSPALIAGLALLGGWALDQAITLVTRWPPLHADKNTLAVVATVIALVGFGYARGSVHLLERTPFSAQRLALWQQAGAWLRQNSLPEMRVWSDHSDVVGYWSERDTVAEAAPDAPPDYAVAVNSLAWTKRLNQPWFQEHYRRVWAIANPYDSLAPLSIYRYRPSPFDAGQLLAVGKCFGASIELMQYRLDSEQLIPGEAQHLTLTWRALELLPKAINVRVRLYETATIGFANRRVWMEIVNDAPANLKSQLWPVGRPMTDRYTLEIPNDLPDGAYQIEVQVLRAENEIIPETNLEHSLGDAVVLAHLEAQPWISDAPLAAAHPLTATFGDRPGGEIELLGYGLRPANDTTPIVERGGGLRVRLYWHALAAPGASYHVFTHLLTEDGRLVAQSGSIPVYGTLPTDQWQAGEYILDEHIIPIGADVPPGRYWLKIGLYTAENGERVAARDAAGREAPERSLPLVQVEVE
jgi:hypothetical protein